MRGIILAAGHGARLGLDLPKCVVEVGGVPLLMHQTKALEAVGVRDLTIVAGHREDLVRALAPSDAEIVVNRDYATTNSLYSFWLTRRPVCDDVVVLNSDVLFPVQVLARVLSELSSAAAVDCTSGADPEHMKVQMEAGIVTAMSKTLPRTATAAENVGIIRLTAPAAAATYQAAARILRVGGQHDWLPAAVSVVARQYPIRGVDVSDLPWTEIDFPADLVRARDVVWPRVKAMRRLAVLTALPRGAAADAVDEVAS